MSHDDQNESYRKRPDQVLVVGMMNVRPGTRSNVRPGGVRRQPDALRPERVRQLPEDVHGVGGIECRELEVGRNESVGGKRGGRTDVGWMTKSRAVLLSHSHGCHSMCLGMRAVLFVAGQEPGNHFSSGVPKQYKYTLTHAHWHTHPHTVVITQSVTEKPRFSFRASLMVRLCDNQLKIHSTRGWRKPRISSAIHTNPFIWTI